jgi:hypothetical protein
MSNKRRNPYYKNKHHKNNSRASTATIVTRAGAARMTKSNKTIATTRATDRTTENKMNVSIEYDETADLHDLNKSMISTALTVNPQDLDHSMLLVTQETDQTIHTTTTYITNLDAT